MMQPITIRGLLFDRTCDSCPEQYDVRDEHDLVVGYVRLRFGCLICRHPNVDGAIVYETTFEDGLKGDFDDDAERMAYLETCAKRLIETICWPE